MTVKPKWSRKKKVLLIFFGLLGVIVLSALVLPSFTVGAREVHLKPSVLAAGCLAGDGGIFKLMTLNIAHGRKDGWHQMLQKTATIRANLDDIAVVLLREQPHVVAMQEADGPSAWSGKFNHVEYLAKAAEMSCFVRAENVKGLQLSYGTALLSMLPMQDAVAITFAPSPPTFSKGFVVSAISLPGKPGLTVDVVSVHLDFSRASVRTIQVEDMITRLRARARPLVIMGDFNCEWTDRDSPVRLLADTFKLKAYQPDAADMITFRSLGKRLDWILISDKLEFVTYRVLSDIVSDHFGVISEVRIVP